MPKQNFLNVKNFDQKSFSDSFTIWAFIIRKYECRKRWSKKEDKIQILTTYLPRADYRDKDQRKANKSLHMVWNGGVGSDLAKDHIFTSMFSHHYRYYYCSVINLSHLSATTTCTSGPKCSDGVG